VRVALALSNVSHCGRRRDAVRSPPERLGPLAQPSQGAARLTLSQVLAGKFGAAR